MSVNLYPITGPWPDADLATAACPHDDDMRFWKQSNVEVVVSALPEDDNESSRCRALGLEFIHFPIGDRATPVTHDTIEGLVQTLIGHLEAGRSVVIHCQAGIGRASLLAACTLVRAGVSVDEAFARISLARGVTVPDTRRQRDWVEQFAKHRIV